MPTSTPTISSNVKDALGFTYLSPEARFRPSQLRAVKANLKYLSGNDVRVMANNAPPGTGKTLLGIATAKLFISQQDDAHEWQTVYLVATKDLQDQVVNECPSYADLRGRSNYVCSASHANSNCQQSQAFCNEGMFCTASTASRIARSTDRLVTNYSLWLTFGQHFGQWIVPKDPETKLPLYSKFFVIMDEAHRLEHELTSALEIKLSIKSIYDACNSDTGTKLVKLFPWTDPPVLPRFAKKVEWKAEELKPWIAGAEKALIYLTQDIEELQTKIENGAALHGKLFKLLELKRHIQMLKFVNPYEWVLDILDKSSVVVQCAVLKSKVPQLLLQNATKVLLMSGTQSPKLLESLGFKPQVVSI